MVHFSWKCPYCNQNATITDDNYSRDIHFFDMDNTEGLLGILTEAVVCPNEQCKEYKVTAYIRKAVYEEGRGRKELVGNPLFHWNLKPQSEAKVYPSYIPKAILDDYNETCLIRNLSPKASATLSRRCLQGIIRDFWGISKARLIDEINELREKTDPTTCAAIDAVRSIGNIGAHMEKDINIIVEVEPKEAGLLIGLIEILLKDWYIAKHEREEHLKKIVAAAEKKEQDKQA